METKTKPKKPAKLCQVTWRHEPDPAAEDEFWRLYLKLALEAMVEAKGQERPR